MTAKKAILSDSLVDAITACVVLEAAGEGKEGMQAVTNVIMTRAKMLGGLDKAYNVVVKPWHFECFNSVTTSYPRGKPVPVEALEGKINQAKKSKSWQVARNLVVEGLAGTLPDITGGADHYYAQRIVKPKWAAEYDKTMKQTTVLGGHTFLTSPAVRSYWQRNGGQPNLPEIGY